MGLCHWGGCTNQPGQAHKYCSRHRSTVADTTEYDPRYERAQTVDGAKARYVTDDVDYDEDALEADLERLLR